MADLPQTAELFPAFPLLLHGNWQPGPAEVTSPNCPGILSSFPSLAPLSSLVNVLVTWDTISYPFGTFPGFQSNTSINHLPQASCGVHNLISFSLSLQLKMSRSDSFKKFTLLQSTLSVSEMYHFLLVLCKIFPLLLFLGFTGTFYSAHKGCGVSQIVAVHALLLLMCVQLSSNCGITQLPLLGILWSSIDLDHSGVKNRCSWTSHDDN